MMGNYKMRIFALAWNFHSSCFGDGMCTLFHADLLRAAANVWFVSNEMNYEKGWQTFPIPCWGRSIQCLAMKGTWCGDFFFAEREVLLLMKHLKVNFSLYRVNGY